MSPESFEVAGIEGTDIQLQGVGTTLDVEEDEDGKSAGMEEGKEHLRIRVAVERKRMKLKIKKMRTVW